MSTMKIHLIVGQMHERYEGEYAPEVLDVADEFSLDNNPEWFEKKLAEHSAKPEYAAVREVVLEVSQDALVAALRAPVLKAAVTPPAAPPAHAHADLCKWLRENSSGVYRKTAEAADVIEELTKAVQTRS